MQPVPLTIKHLPLCDQAVLIIYVVAVAVALIDWAFKKDPVKWFVIGAFLGLTGVVFGLILPKL